MKPRGHNRLGDSIRALETQQMFWNTRADQVRRMIPFIKPEELEKHKDWLTNIETRLAAIETELEELRNRQKSQN